MSVIWQAEPTGLEMQFFLDVDDLLHLLPDVWYVTCGFRSIKESDRLYAIYQKGGPKAAPGGLSPHNIGEAVDVVLDGDQQKPGLQMNWNWDHPAWHRLFDAIKAHPRLHSGASFGDGPHIESVKFTRNKRKDTNGHYYIPAQNLHYLNDSPTNIRKA
jgi:hypothetical protein